MEYTQNTNYSFSKTTYIKLYKMRVLCNFGAKDDAQNKSAKIAQNTPFCKAISWEVRFAHNMRHQNANLTEPNETTNSVRLRVRADIFLLTYWLFFENTV